MNQGYCPICKNNGITCVIPYDKHCISQCLSCYSYFYNPMLSEEENSKLYTEDYIDHQMLDVGLSDSRLVIYKSEIPRIKKLLPDKSSRILDIGCGEGNFLKLLQKNGYQNLTGTELIKNGADRAAKLIGCIVYNKKLHECDFRDKYFDLITLWDVFDQMLDPIGELTEIKRILKDNGIIILRVRNMSIHIPLHRFNVLLRSLKLPLTPSLMHIYGFNQHSLKKIFSQNGFDPIIVNNSRLSKGTPYGSSGIIYSAFMFAAKIFSYFLARVIAFSTFNRILLSPSVIIYARKLPCS